MKNYFLVQPSQHLYFTYDEFFDRIKKQKYYNPFLNTENLLDFYLNLVLALLHHHPKTAINAVQHPAEPLEHPEKSMYYNTHSFTSINDLIAAVNSAKSILNLKSSGTTGEAKTITLQLATFLEQARTGLQYTNNIWATSYHPGHMGGLQVFFQAFLNKNPLIFLNDLTTKETTLILHKYPVTHLSATPTFYKMLLPLETPLLHITRVSLGGEAADEYLFQQLKAGFPKARFNNIFASTETGALMVSHGSYFTIPEKNKGVLKIINSQLNFHRSLVEKVKEDALLNQEWIPTGDLVEMIDDVQFKFIGRESDFVNVAGNMVNLAAVQSTVDQIEGVKRSRVYARKNPLTEHLLCCDVETEDSLADLRVIKDQLFKLLPDYQVPRIIKKVNAIAITASGKVRRSSPITE